ncbi:procathepsin L [Patella vulgata]|uniref:procathepsin L n=1 Tax=Patella vulgata TaxID=6465 RepID=UPI0021804658|nr:procathepsin L [Patella vulgata]
MLRFVLLAVLCSACLAINSELDGDWVAYKKQYSKIYNPLSDNLRRIVWESNLEIIERHNKEADNGLKSYRLGMNQYGDMTNAEFVAIMNGYRSSEHKPSGLTFVSETPVNELPKEVDWRKKGYVTEIKNQGQCGSCWSFSATGSLEGQHFKKTGKLVSLSEQNIMDCSRREGNMGCEGGLMDQAFKYIKKNHGVDTEASYPYRARDEKCHFKRADVGANLTSHVDVKKDNEDDLQKAVAEAGPVSVAIDASHNSFQLYKSGVYDEKQCSSVNLDHGVLAVGYGAREGKDYWLVKNSWGESWGMSGYIMMSRNKKNQCGIATSASYPLV